MGDRKSVDNEINIMQRCHHSNIVKLFQFFELPKSFCLIIEYVNGGDLFDAIREARRFTELDAGRIVRDVCNALVFLHDRKIAHRDIKPENILIQKSSSLHNISYIHAAKLADFGLATIVVGPLVEMCSTPTYVAPEVLARCGYTYQIDLWSLGVISYILLSGYPPFRSSSTEGSYALIQKGQFTFAASHWNNITRAAKHFISSLLVVDQNARQTARSAIGHPWLQMNTDDVNLPDLYRQVTENLKLYQRNLNHANNP